MTVSERFGSRTASTMLGDHELRNRLPKTLLLEYSSNAENIVVSDAGNQNGLVVCSGKKRSGSSNKIASAIKEHVKEKLSLGTKILQVGGLKKGFKRLFKVSEGERLLKASPCSLFTTAGPFPGLLFISTHKIAFCSNRPVLKFCAPSGELLRFHYKVVIPLRKIDGASQTENTSKTSEKYLQVVTTDDFEFWFTGFKNYEKTFKRLQQAISQL